MRNRDLRTAEPQFRLLTSVSRLPDGGGEVGAMRIVYG
jgi:hypothetical protein